MSVQIPGGGKIHKTEPAGIIMAYGDTTIGFNDYMVVRFLRRQIARENPEPTRHPQVRDPDCIIVKTDGQKLGASGHQYDFPISQALTKAVRQRPPKVCASDDDPRQSLAFQDRRKAAPDGFHFGQFGHGSGP